MKQRLDYILASNNHAVHIHVKQDCGFSDVLCQFFIMQVSHFVESLLHKELAVPL